MHLLEDGTMNAERRDQLRQQWLEQAEAAFAILFDAQRQDLLVTLDQRETLSVSLGRELANWLLEQHLADDPAARPGDDASVACPKCQRAAVRQTPAHDAAPPRSVTCRSGEVTYRREQWRCPSCRIIFFSAGPAVGVGDRGV